MNTLKHFGIKKQVIRGDTKSYSKLGSMTKAEAKELAKSMGLHAVRFNDGSWDVE
jgi:hypothetical protein